MQYLFHSIQYVVGDLSWHSIYFNVYFFLDTFGVYRSENVVVKL